MGKHIVYKMNETFLINIDYNNEYILDIWQRHDHDTLVNEVREHTLTIEKLMYESTLLMVYTEIVLFVPCHSSGVLVVKMVKDWGRLNK